MSISQGRALFAALQDSARLPLPRYVLDLPDGRGKIPVMDMQQITAGTWTYQHPDGSLSTYHDWLETPLEQPHQPSAHAHH